MKKLLFLFLISLSVLSCDDKKDPEPTGTAMENLTGTGTKKWKLSVAKAISGGGELNLIQIFPCWGDNVLTLNSDGTYTLEDAGVECDPKEVTINAQWTLQDTPQQIKLGKLTIAGHVYENLILNDTKINANQFSGVTGRVTLGELSADRLEMTFVEVK